MLALDYIKQAQKKKKIRKIFPYCTRHRFFNCQRKYLYVVLLLCCLENLTKKTAVIAEVKNAIRSKGTV